MMSYIEYLFYIFVYIYIKDGKAYIKILTVKETADLHITDPYP